MAAFVQTALREHPGLTFRRGTVAGIRPTPGGAVVAVDGETLTARWVFDSTGWAAGHRGAPAAEGANLRQKV